MSCLPCSSKGSPLPESDLALLTEAAEEAGKIARRYWRRQPRAWDKPGGAGPVTEADIAVNAMLHSELGRARKDYGWLSEESPDDAARLECARCFIVDPIDGTRAFMQGEDGFSHSLAVAERGKVIAAVVYLPIREALYVATHTGPALLDGMPIRVSDREGLLDATVLTSKPSLAPAHWKAGRAPEMRREFRTSLAWRLCLVAEGRFDAMITLRPTWEWDIAAGELIAQQAGATVSDRAGREIRYNAPRPLTSGILAGPAPLWRDLRAALKDD